MLDEVDLPGQANMEKGDKQEGDDVVFRGDDTEETVEGDDGHLQRNLKSRHLQMIALGGTIGTGLFVGTGGALSAAGPAGILIAYSLMGFVVYSMMIALGELTTLYPVNGAFTHYASRFVDPALGFALGWNYWYLYTITLPAELSAAAVVINYWQGAHGINPGVWIAVFLVTICAFNFTGVRAYGEAEFWMSVIKIVTIVGLIIGGIVISAGGVPGTPAIGFKYWHDPGAGIPGAKGRFLAFFSVFIQSAYSFIGTEIVALTAGEAANPRRNVPKAIQRVFWRIVIFYVLSVFIIGLIISPTAPGLVTPENYSAGSPWTVAFHDAGVKGLPSVINAVILIAAFSAGNSDLYASSRTLYGLACDGKAPKFFRRVNKRGVPYYAVGFTASFALLGFISCATTSGPGAIFNDFAGLAALCGLLTWAAILFSYLRFYYGVKRQGIDRSEFSYVAPMQPYASYFGLIFVLIVVFFNGFKVFMTGNFTGASFVLSYIIIISFVVLYACWKLYHKTRFVHLDEMDFETGRRELDEMSDAEQLAYEAPTTIPGKIFDWLF
ncbi:hypothetical protein RQP46_004085 [Phenoliferia psychrophenolica]